MALAEVNGRYIESLLNQLKLNLLFHLENQEMCDNDLPSLLEATKSLVFASQSKHVLSNLCNISDCQKNATCPSYIPTKLFSERPTVIYCCSQHYSNIESLTKSYSRCLTRWIREFIDTPTIIISNWTIKSMDLCYRRELHTSLTVLSSYLMEMKELLKMGIVHSSEWSRINFEHENILENIRNASYAIQEAVNDSE